MRAPADAPYMSDDLGMTAPWWAKRPSGAWGLPGSENPLLWECCGPTCMRKERELEIDIFRRPPPLRGRGRRAPLGPGERTAEGLNMPLPPHARAVIIGGGVSGCSVAYHLSKLGWTDIVLLERKQLTCGTTWLCGGPGGAAARQPEHLTRLAKYSADLYLRLRRRDRHRHRQCGRQARSRSG